MIQSYSEILYMCIMQSEDSWQKVRLKKEYENLSSYPHINMIEILTETSSFKLLTIAYLP